MRAKRSNLLQSPALKKKRPPLQAADFLRRLRASLNSRPTRLKSVRGRLAPFLPKIPGGKRPLQTAFDLLLFIAVAASLLFYFFSFSADDGFREISLASDGFAARYKARVSTVSEFLKRSGITLNSADTLSHDLGKTIENDMELSVTRAFPVAVESLSHVTLLNMTGGTVGQALSLAGVKAGVEDELSNQPFESVTPGMKIRHVDVEISYPYEPSKNIVTLYYREIAQKDSNMYNYKDPVVIQEGKNGRKEVTRRVISKNGVVVSREIVDQRVLEPAVDEIVRIGTKVHYQTSYVGETRTFNRHNINRPVDGQGGWKKMTVHAVTGYASGTRTSTGTKPKLGTIAVNPSLIPYYTQIYVPHYGYGTALDTGAFRNYSGEKANAIDLWFNTRAEAVRWGRKTNYTIYVKMK